MIKKVYRDYTEKYTEKYIFAFDVSLNNLDTTKRPAKCESQKLVLSEREESEQNICITAMQCAIKCTIHWKRKKVNAKCTLNTFLAGKIVIHIFLSLSLFSWINDH